MTRPTNPLVRLLQRFASRLRFPQLFLLTALLFLIDLAVPDFIPFADEILLALGTLLLGSLRKRELPGAASAGGTGPPSGRPDQPNRA